MQRHAWKRSVWIVRRCYVLAKRNHKITNTRQNQELEMIKKAANLFYLSMCLCFDRLLQKNSNILHNHFHLLSAKNIYQRNMYRNKKKNALLLITVLAHLHDKKKKTKCIDTQFDYLAENPSQSKVFYFKR